MKPPELAPMQALRRSLWMVAQAAPKELRNLAMLNLITGTGPSIALLLSKIVIDEAAQLLGNRSQESAIALLLSHPVLLWSMVAVVLLNLFYDVALATGPIFQLLDLQPQLITGYKAMTAAAQTHPSQRGIQFRDVSFAYPGSERSTLERITLAIQPGEMVALVGENGARKTTLAKLLCRLYDPTQGSISF